MESGDPAWLREFERKHGRPLRVLHVGNIANNAYLNAKFLRQAGIDCHVLCYDYYEVASTPEWEEWDGRGYSRPTWFVQGPVVLSTRYLHALVSGEVARGFLLWQRLRPYRLLAPHPRSMRLWRGVRFLRERVFWPTRRAGSKGKTAYRHLKSAGRTELLELRGLPPP